MLINREKLLGVLELVAPGLSSREILEQSSCVVFRDEKVVTFNDEITCSIVSPLTGIEGAVQADSLMALLRKLGEDKVEVEVTGGELIVKGKGKRSGIRMEKETTLRIDSVETPQHWKKIPDGLFEAMRIAQRCASRDESEPVLVCVHVHPEWVEASDQFQVVRYPIKTGLDRSMLIRSESVKCVVNTKATKIGQTEGWVHFQADSELVLSCRRYVEKFPNVEHILGVKGIPATLPKGLANAIDKAEIFSSQVADDNQVGVELRPGLLKLIGRGPGGWYSEVRKIDYDGEKIGFRIAPKLLEEILRYTDKCEVAEGRLIVQTDKFRWVACTAKVEE